MRHGKSFALNPKGCIPTDVWSVACANARAGHYAVFPEALVERIILTCSNPNDLVLDPFVGSGTTCVVASRLGRRCLGIELNPMYAELALAATQSALAGLRKTA
jgi:DNA modification methylase